MRGRTKPLLVVAGVLLADTSPAAVGAAGLCLRWGGRPLGRGGPGGGGPPAAVPAAQRHAAGAGPPGRADRQFGGTPYARLPSPNSSQLGGGCPWLSCPMSGSFHAVIPPRHCGVPCSMDEEWRSAKNYGEFSRSYFGEILRLFSCAVPSAAQTPPNPRAS